MESKKRVILFTAFAGIFGALSAVTAATPAIRPLFIVLPLVCMGIFLFFAGYYAGLSKAGK